MRLTMKERRLLTKTLCAQYRRASKKTKGMLLDQFVESTGYNRCYARSLLRNHGRRVAVAPGVLLEGDAKPKAREPRPPEYGPEVAAPLGKIWRMLDYIAAKRLAAALPEVLPRLEAHKELRVAKAVRAKLLRISPATIDRLLKPERDRLVLSKGRGHTKPGTLLKHQIPIRTFADWDQARPGFLEMDLVGHDGGNTAGDYCFTLDITDVSSGWTEQAATLNKAQIHVFSALETVRVRLPFPVLGLDSDNGSEFINAHLKNWCDEEKITFTRSRPYRKNDTCYVEQKNWSVVRRFAGYARFEGEESRALLNELYVLLRDYNNFFLPSMKLVEKIRDGAKVKRIYDTPRTPYHRLLDSPHVSARDKRRLRAHYDILNLAELRRRIVAVQKTLVRKAIRMRPPEEREE